MIIIDINNTDLLNVQSVVVIPKAKTSTQENKDQRKGYRRKNFTSIFDSAVEKEVSNKVAYDSHGYTKDAKSYNTHYETKDYN